MPRRTPFASTWKFCVLSGYRHHVLCRGLAAGDAGQRLLPVIGGLYVNLDVAVAGGVVDVLFQCTSRLRTLGCVDVFFFAAEGFAGHRNTGQFEAPEHDEYRHQREGEQRLAEACTAGIALIQLGYVLR